MLIEREIVLFSVGLGFVSDFMRSTNRLATKQPLNGKGLQFGMRVHRMRQRMTGTISLKTTDITLHARTAVQFGRNKVNASPISSHAHTRCTWRQPFIIYYYYTCAQQTECFCLEENAHENRNSTETEMVLLYLLQCLQQTIFSL